MFVFAVWLGIQAFFSLSLRLTTINYITIFLSHSRLRVVTTHILLDVEDREVLTRGDD